VREQVDKLKRVTGREKPDLKSEEAKKQERSPCYKLHHFTDLPAWMQDNPRLLTGYRVNIGWRESARSACHVHNETVNFWTHALSFVGIGVTLIMTLAFVSPYGTDRLAFDVWKATHWEESPAAPAGPFQEEADILFAPVTTQPVCPAPNLDSHDSWHSDDVIERVKHHLPSMSRLTALLREKAEDLAAGKEHFLSYISSLEAQLHNVSLQATIEDSVATLKDSGVGHLVTRAQLDVEEATHHILCSFNEFLNEQNTEDDSKIEFHFKLSPSSGSLHSYMAVWPIALYVITAMCCLGFSAIFHLFQAVDQRWAENLQSLDYAGICLLISGSCVAIVYYGLYCVPFWMWLYISVQCFMGIIGTIITIMLRDPKYRIVKTFTFIALGVMGVVPVTHIYIHLQDAYWFLWYLGLMGAMYLGGAAIYLTRVPEVWYPESFDICGSSHQIWHILIVLAVFTLYVGLLNFFEWRIATGCPAGH
jgi:adiponectin receptor